MKTNKEELKVLWKYGQRYSVGMPERMRGKGLCESTIRIAVKNGEYHYIPSFWSSCRLTSDELIAIAKKIDRLNEEKCIR